MRNERVRRSASITAALVIVIAALGGGFGPVSPVGVASAEVLPDCGWEDASIWGMSKMLYRTSIDADTGCRVDLSFGEDTTAALDLYAGGMALHESQETAVATVNNRLVDTRAPAYTEAKIAMIREYNAGGNESEVRESAYDAVDEIYSPIMVNLNSLWIQKVEYWNYTWRAEVQRDNSYGIWAGNQNLPLEDCSGDNLCPNISDREMTLPNGSTVPTVVIHGDHFEAGLLDIHWTDEDTLAGDLPTRVPSGDDNAIVLKNDNTGDNIVLLEVPHEGSETWWVEDDFGGPHVGIGAEDEKLHYHFNQINQQITQIKENIDPLVNDTFDQYEPGDLDTTEVLSPIELAQRGATDYNSTGFYTFHAAQLATMGYAGDIGHSHTIDSNGTTYDGTLFYTGDDVEVLEIGTEYTPSELNGTFVMSYQVDENSSDVIELEEPFVITDQTDTQTGETVENASIESYTYETVNSSDLSDELEELHQLKEELDEIADSSSGGGGFLDGLASWFGNLTSGLGTGILLVGLAILLLFGRG